MKFRFTVILLLALLLSSQLKAQQTFPLSVSLQVAENLRESFASEGRLLLFLCQHPRVEPRTQTWPHPYAKNDIFAMNMVNIRAAETLILDHTAEWVRTTEWNLDQVPEGEYYLQVLWDQDMEESNINAPGNLYSEKQKVVVNEATHLEIELDQKIGPRVVEEHPLVRLVDMKSEALTKWWGKPMHLKATILLPSQYKEGDGKAYPIRYNVAGYGGRYTRINRMVQNRGFMEWWNSEDAPQVINVFLDGEGPFGDSYQMDSENSGPYGFALIHELIPHIESTYRGTDTPDTRFVDGCSTGGWVSLGLQLYYPENFNGAFSYSPDAIDFENYQLINIYQDQNGFVNEFGYVRPVMRDVNGEPMMSLEKFLTYENVLGRSNSYVTSGGQFSAHTALYSPKGEDG
jgi:hypothetical protein